MRVEVKVPQLPESVAEATLVSWHKKLGDTVARDENLVDVETDKVVLELPAPQAGVLVEIRQGDGATVAGQQVIAVIDSDGKAGAAATVPAVPKAAAAPPATPAGKAAPPSSSPAAAAAAAATSTTTALPAARKIMADLVSHVVEEIFMPLTVGGGIRTPDDVDRMLRAGADKVSVNTAAIARPELLGEMARRFGSQCIVLSVDARTVPEGNAPTPSGWEVTTHGGRRGTGIDAVEWAVRGAELGVGEILLNSMDADGTKAGFDLPMLKAVRAAVSVPVIASGGAGAVEHFAPAVVAGADAVLAASVFHFRELTIGQVKAAMAAEGIIVR